MGEMQAAIPPEFRQDADELPPLVRALLEAELAAGNSIAEVGHRFPAPPAGAYFKLAARVSTRPHESGGGLTYRAVNGSIYSGYFGDERGFYFIVEPPLPPPPEPDMEAIRAAHNAPKPYRPAFGSDPNTAPGRFERSMEIDYEKWHDGIGYDIETLRGASEAERRQIETLLLARGVRDWRDVEALAALDTPQANEALRAALRHPDPEIRMAVARCAPQLVAEEERAASLAEALRTAEFMGGLSQALDDAAKFHPREVVEALLRGVLHRDGEAAFHFSALLLFIHGKAASPFDWDRRPFFFRFDTADRKAREAAFRDLCQEIGVDSSEYL
jgi:hypothetical protein